MLIFLIRNTADEDVETKKLFHETSLKRLESRESTSFVLLCDASVGDNSELPTEETSGIGDSEKSFMNLAEQNSVIEGAEVVKSYETIEKISPKTSEIQKDSSIIRSYHDSNENMTIFKSESVIEACESETEVTKSYETIAKISPTASRIRTESSIIRSYHDSNENISHWKSEPKIVDLVDSKGNYNSKKDTPIPQRKSLEKIRESKPVQRSLELFEKNSEDLESDKVETARSAPAYLLKWSSDDESSQKPKQLGVKSVKSTAKLFSKDSEEIAESECLPKLDRKSLELTKPKKLGRMSVVSTAEIFAKISDMARSTPLSTSSDGKLCRMKADVTRLKFINKSFKSASEFFSSRTGTSPVVSGSITSPQVVKVTKKTHIEFDESAIANSPKIEETIERIIDPGSESTFNTRYGNVNSNEQLTGTGDSAVATPTTVEVGLFGCKLISENEIEKVSVFHGTIFTRLFQYRNFHNELRN